MSKNSYFKNIKKIAKDIPQVLIDFSAPRSVVRIPTQASSNFITNKEQGDWAEKLLLASINKYSKKHIAIKYGKSDNIVAGEEGFNDFFQEFQNELDEIGKRPDLLIFKKNDFRKDLGYDISRFSNTDISEYVKLAIAGIEVRSSAFLVNKYESAMNKRTEYHTNKALEIKDYILNNYLELLNNPTRSGYQKVLSGINKDTLLVTDFRVPSWSASEELIELKNHFKELKKSIKEIQKRDYLSITPKVEDIKVVYKWTEIFNVPHYYFQVFFDKIYGISFEQILKTISDPNNEGTIFSVESDTKNQNKTTIKISIKSSYPVASRVDEPKHKSMRKELNRGRLLFYVSFEGGMAYLDIKSLCKVLNIKENEF